MLILKLKYNKNT